MQIKKKSVSSVIIDVLACYDETGKSEMQDLCLFMYLGPENQWCEDPIGIAPFIICLFFKRIIPLMSSFRHY